MNKNMVVGTILLAVVVVVGVTVWSSGDNETSQGQKVIPGDASSVGLIVGKNALNINEQKVGNSATVSLVVLEKQGYVVIHEMKNGKPEEIVGASALLNAGQSNNVSVELSTSLKEGESYVAMLHLDNGDGIFDGVSDMPARNEADTIMMEFQVGNGSDNGAVSI